MKMSIKTDIDFAKILRTEKAALSRALEKSAIVVEGDAAALCAVDTGNLRESIRREVGEKEAIVGTNTNYAPYLEYGTSNMKAQPYLRPALIKNKNKILGIFQSEFQGAN